MDVILHVGAHRTGTTTLQRFLAANRAALAGHGIAVWGPERTRDGLFSGLVKAPHRITLEDERRGRRSCGMIRVELQRLADRGIGTLIVSEENMIGSMENNIFNRRLYPHAGERLERFFDGFGAQTVRVALGVRSYDRAWASALGYFLKAGFPLPEDAGIRALAEQPGRWRHVVRRIAQVFPAAKLAVWPFEALVGLPEVQLAALLGRPLPGPFAATREWHNAGPSRAALHGLLAGAGAPPAALARIGAGPGAWHPFTPGETAMMRAAYAQDLGWLRAGAEGLATYTDSPAAEPGATGQRRGGQNDQQHGRMARTGREGIAGPLAG